MINCRMFSLTFASTSIPDGNECWEMEWVVFTVLIQLFTIKSHEVFLTAKPSLICLVFSSWFYIR